MAPAMLGSAQGRDRLLGKNWLWCHLGDKHCDLWRTCRKVSHCLENTRS